MITDCYMRIISNKTSYACAVLSLCATLAHALPRQGVSSTTMAYDSIRSLREVMIYANSKHDIVPTQKLSGKRLESLSSLSLADAVRYFSGVQIKDYGGVGGLKTIDVRSMGTNHMGVFYDGIQLGNAQNGQVDLGKFSMDNIAEISLYNGQKSDLFQSAKDYGSAGTIYIRSRRPQFANKNDNIRLSMKSGSFGLLNPSLLWEHRWSDAVSTSISAENISATGEYRFRYRKTMSDGSVAWDTTAVRQNGDISSWRVEGSVYGLVKDVVWDAKAYYYHSDKGIPGAIVNNVWKHWQRQTDRNVFLQGSLKQRVNDQYEWQLRWKYANDYMHYQNPDTTLMHIDNCFEQRELYVTTAHHISLTPAWDINIAVDYQYNTLDASLYNFVYPCRQTVLGALATSYRLGRIRAMASILSTNIIEGTKSGKAPDNTYELTPAVFLSYKHSDNLFFRMFYKHIFRMPTFNDLYYTDIGNIALEPEHATQWNAGWLYSRQLDCGWLKQVELKGDAYHNIISNKIVAIPKGNGQYRWMMMNIGKVKITGAELSAQAVLQPHYDWMLNLHASYTYQKALDRSDPSDNDPIAGTYGGQIAYVPLHSGSMTANLTFKAFGLNYAFVYVGERYHNSSNIRANYEMPWYTSDLSVSYDVRLKHTKLKAAMECNNVFDQQYDVVLNYPMPGRNWRLSLKLSL